jgi:CheY-like chemotaxis protein
VKFVGDLDDPWVVAIAGALPGETSRVHCPGELAADLIDDAPAVLVVHRANLTQRDAAIFDRMNPGGGAPTRVVLCYGPHVRQSELEQWLERVDSAIPEATARETVARRVATALGARAGEDARRIAPRNRPVVAVVSTNPALRQTLGQLVRAAGYPAAEAWDWPDAAMGGPAVWDVPVLDPGWPHALARRAKTGPIIALLGFADRPTVSRARALGASSCLELPVDLGDLADAIDRVASTRFEPAHDAPPPPHAKQSSIVPRHRAAESDP